MENTISKSNGKKNEKAKDRQKALNIDSAKVKVMSKGQLLKFGALMQTEYSS